MQVLMHLNRPLVNAENCTANSTISLSKLLDINLPFQDVIGNTQGCCLAFCRSLFYST